MTDNIFGQTVSYTYDTLKRLTGATAVGANAWSQNYTYDGFGNMTGKTGTGANLTVSVDQTKNQLVSPKFCYDGNGNMISDQNGGGCAGPNYSYDMANRLLTAVVSGGAERYLYTADNKRVSTITSYSSGAAPTQTIYIYGAMGELLTVLSPNAYTTNNVYFAGRMIKQNTDTPIQGLPSVPADLNFVLTDRLGSVRGGANIQPGSYFPYGENQTVFATYFLNANTGLHYADQRFYSGQLGRFMSADRFKQAAKANDSASWNKYLYSRNDPVNRYDRHGTCDELLLDFDAEDGESGACDDGDSWGDLDSSTAAACSANNLAYDPNTDSCVEPQQNQQTNTKPDPCPSNIKNFFNVVIPLASQIATKWNTGVNDILAVSAFESGWLGKHAKDLHNLFGSTNKGGPNINFPSYQDSANYFSNHDGGYISGITDISKFAAALQPHYNTHKTYWIDTLENVYDSVLNWRTICNQ